MTPARTTDDFPFPYLVGRGIPGFYQVALLAILVASTIAVRVAGGPFREMRPYVDLFFMGAAFLLLETTNVVRFALLFGTTWFVNALVFAGILGAVLLTGYLGGAIATHVRVGSPLLGYTFFPIYVAAMVWGGIYLRDARLRTLLPLRHPL